GFRDMLSGSWFVKEGEADQYQLQYGQQARQVLEHLKQIRFDMFWGDALKFLVIALITVGTTLMFLNRKLRTTTTFIGILIVTLFVDLYIVDKEFVNPHPKADLDHAFKPDETIAFLKEQDGHFRVFPMGRLFGDNTYAYHGIHSIGGYSAAKLKIYQTMIDSCLYEGSDPSFPVNMSILNMLGVRYIVTPAEIPNSQFKKVNSDSTKGIFTYHNPLALPRVYLVDEAISARGDAEVFAMLNSPAFDPSRTAVLQDPAPTKVFPQDSSSSATILDYQARRILIEVNTSDPTLLVLSEVFYPAGWRALVDGTETPILRTNSILRSIMVPAGKHSVVFSFDPPMYEMGWQLTQIAWTLSSVLVLVPLTVYAVQAIRKRRQPPSPSDNGRQDVNSNS
ncbi:MAG: YfhO family protein, partial [Bacteroidota bacterium]